MAELISAIWFLFMGTITLLTIVESTLIFLPQLFIQSPFAYETIVHEADLFGGVIEKHLNINL